MRRNDLARIVIAVIAGIGAAIVVPQLPVLGANGNPQGCAVGQRSHPVGDHSHPVGDHSHPVGEHSKPCPTPSGCAIGKGGAVGDHSHPVGDHSRPVGDHSKPCPTPPRCAIGNGGPVSAHSKPCPTPSGCARGNPQFVGNASKPCPTPHRKSRLAGLAGSFTGTQHFTFATNGCTFVHQVFDATYSSASDGTVTLHIEGCVSPDITQYSGTFTIAASAGTLDGTVLGSVDVSSVPGTFDLTAAATSGTGEFKKPGGTLNIHISWNGGPVISGTVSVTAHQASAASHTQGGRSSTPYTRPTTRTHESSTRPTVAAGAHRRS
jgi:hypothetical protein